MACIRPDGLLTRCGESVLLVMWTPATLESVAEQCEVPLFRVRAAAREFLEAGLIDKNGADYVVTVSGISRMEG